MRIETLWNHFLTDGYHLSSKEIESIETFVSNTQIDGYLIVPKEAILNAPKKDKRAFCVQNGLLTTLDKIDESQFLFGVYYALGGIILVFPKEH